MPHKTKSPGKGGKRKHAGQRVKVKKQAVDSKNSHPRKLMKRKAKKLKSEETPEPETSHSQNSLPRRSNRLASRRCEGTEAEETTIEKSEILNLKGLSVRIKKDEKTAADRHLPSSIPSSDSSKKTRKRSGSDQNAIANAANLKTKITKTRNPVVRIKQQDKTAAEKHLRNSIPSSTSSRKRSKSSDALPNIMEGASTSGAVAVAPPVNLKDTAANKEASTSGSSGLSLSSVKSNVEIDPERLISTPIPSDVDLKRKSLSISPIRSPKPDAKKCKVEASDENPNCESTENLDAKKFKVEPSEENSNCESTNSTLKSNSELNDAWDKVAPDENKYNAAKDLDLVSELGDTDSNSDTDHERSKTIMDSYSTFVDSDYELERKNKKIKPDTKKCKVEASNESPNCKSIENLYAKIIKVEPSEENSNCESTKKPDTKKCKVESSESAENIKNEETSVENTPKLKNEDQKKNAEADRKETKLLTSTPIASLDAKRKKKSPPMSPIESKNPVKKEDERESS